LAVLKPFQLSIVRTLLENYRFDQPFHNYFASQCKLHRNWGSKDRKIYKNACYAYFRLGFMITTGSVESNILFAGQDISEIRLQAGAMDIFPHKAWVSGNIDFDAWAGSMLLMRPAYLSVKNGCLEKTKDWLASKAIDFEVINNYCLRVGADSKCDEIVEKGWVWIMDVSSAMAADAIEVGQGEKVWDACSGAGGKALFLVNKYQGDFDLTCSDLRFSVLENLKARFYATALKMPRIELADLNERFQLKDKYDKIILDVPCTGSGTWGRTPENISTVTRGKIEGFSELQKNIMRNAIKNLKEGGRVYYLTCSVFSAENEDNIHYFSENFGLKKLDDKYLVHDYSRSDILYFAELQKL
jgi:16S rRNA (cytosine967-C5)-methyltransferase